MYLKYWAKYQVLLAKYKYFFFKYLRTDAKYQVLLDQVQVLVNLNNQVLSSTGKMCTWQVQVQVLEYLNPTLMP